MANEQQGSEAKVDVAPSGAGVSSPSIEKGIEQTASPSVNGQAQPTQEKPESIPFGDKRHTEYKRFRELNESAKRANERADKLERELSEMRGWREAMTQQGQRQELPPDQKQALVQLFQMGMSVPEVKDMIAKSYGLDRLDSLNKDYSSFKENWEGNQFNSEMSDVLKSAQEIGLDPDEVQSELEEHVSNHPFFSNKEYYKGAVWAAFRDKYWDKVGELRERADNKKKIEERERLKNGQTQGAAETGKAGEPALPEKDGVRRNLEIIRRAGGVEKLPFFR